MSLSEDDTRVYRVVVNHEGQYSLWEGDRSRPAGWNECGVTGSRSECLAHIARVWTDMRPLSLRQAMAGYTENADGGYATDAEAAGESSGAGGLVRRLAEADSEVDLGDDPGPTSDLRRRIEHLRYVSIRFTGTRGGTVLGITVDPAATDLSAADFFDGTGTVHIEGDLRLDHVPVRCVADIDIAVRRGVGRLRIVDPQHNAGRPDRQRHALTDDGTTEVESLP